ESGHFGALESSERLAADARSDDEEADGQQFQIVEAPDDFLQANRVSELFVSGERAHGHRPRRLASCQSASISFIVASLGAFPRSSRPFSTWSNLRRNFALAPRSACSGSTFRNRAMFTITKSRSPISSWSASCDALSRAASSSASSSWSFSST